MIVLVRYFHSQKKPETKYYISVDKETFRVYYHSGECKNCGLDFAHECQEPSEFWHIEELSEHLEECGYKGLEYDEKYKDIISVWERVK